MNAHALPAAAALAAFVPAAAMPAAAAPVAAALASAAPAAAAPLAAALRADPGAVVADDEVARAAAAAAAAGRADAAALAEAELSKHRFLREAVEAGAAEDARAAARAGPPFSGAITLAAWASEAPAPHTRGACPPKGEMVAAVLARMDEHVKKEAAAFAARCVAAVSFGEGGERQDELVAFFDEPLERERLVAAGLRGAGAGRLCGASEGELADLIASDLLPAAQARASTLRERHFSDVVPARTRLAARVAELSRPRRTALDLLAAHLTPALSAADAEMFLAPDEADRFAAEQQRLLAARLMPAVLFAAISDVPADDSSSKILDFEAHKLGQWKSVLFHRAKPFALMSDGRVKWARATQDALAADAAHTMLPPLVFAPRAPHEGPASGRITGEFKNPAMVSLFAAPPEAQARAAQLAISRHVHASAAAGGASSLTWEADAEACKLCDEAFGLLPLRRHHCRACGINVCSACSAGVGDERACAACCAFAEAEDDFIREPIAAYIRRGATLQLEFANEAACMKTRSFFERFSAARQACLAAGAFGARDVWTYCLERGGLTLPRLEAVEEAINDAAEALSATWATVAKARIERVRAARRDNAIAAIEAHAVVEAELASAAFREMAVDVGPAAARRARAAERLALASANVSRFARSVRDLVLLLPPGTTAAQLPSGASARLAAAATLALSRSPAMAQLAQAHAGLLEALASQEARASGALAEVTSAVTAWAARHTLGVAASLADPAAAHSLITQLVSEVPELAQGLARRAAEIHVPPYAFSAALALGMRQCEAELESRVALVALGIVTVREAARVNGATTHLRIDACPPSARRAASAEAYSAAQRVVADAAAAPLAASAAAFLDFKTSAARLALEQGCAADEARNTAAYRAAEAQLSAFAASVSSAVLLEPRSCASAAMAAEKARACLALSASTLLPTVARGIAAAALPPYCAAVLSARAHMQATAAIGAAYGFARDRRDAEAAFDAAVAEAVRQLQPLSADDSEPLPRRDAANAALSAAASAFTNAMAAHPGAGDAVLAALVQERGIAVANVCEGIFDACEQQEARNRSDSSRADALVASFVAALSPSVLQRSGRLSIAAARAAVTAARGAGLTSLVAAVRECGHADYARSALEASARARATSALGVAEACVTERESWQRLEAQWRASKETELAGFAVLVAELRCVDAAVDERRARGDAAERAILQRLDSLVPGPASLPSDMAGELRGEARREAASTKRSLTEELQAQEARDRGDSARADALVASFIAVLAPSVLGRSGRLSIGAARAAVTAARGVGLTSLIAAVRECGHADYARSALEASARARATSALGVAEACVTERESWQRLEAQWRARKQTELAGFTAFVAEMKHFDSAVDERRTRTDAEEQAILQRLDSLVPGPASLPQDMAGELRGEARREAASIKNTLAEVLRSQDEEWRAALREATTLLAPAVAALDRVSSMGTSNAAAKALETAIRIFAGAEQSLGASRAFAVTASVSHARSIYESKLRSAQLVVEGLAETEAAEEEGRRAREARERREEAARERRRENEVRDARRQLEAMQLREQIAAAQQREKLAAANNARAEAQRVASLGKQLLAACRNGNRDDVAAALQLINEGADLNCVVGYDEEHRVGWSTLMRACDTEGLDEVAARLIASGANIDHISRDGDTPLIRACIKSREKTAMLLIMAGAELNQINDNGNSALNWANRSGLVAVAAAIRARGGRTCAELRE